MGAKASDILTGAKVAASVLAPESSKPYVQVADAVLRDNGNGTVSVDTNAAIDLVAAKLKK